MTHHRHAQESFNRASHSDALCEMQLEPAETLQADRERPTPASVLASIPARDFFAAVGLTLIAWFIAAAMCALFPGA